MEAAALEGVLAEVRVAYAGSVDGLEGLVSVPRIA